MISSVIGGAMLPHAPQFVTMPETEDRGIVERVKAAAGEIGGKLKALAPDLWIIFSNDHAEQFFHRAAPAFTVHVGEVATGAFAGREFCWQVPSEVGFELVRQMYRQGFDPAFTSTAKIDSAIGNSPRASWCRRSRSANLHQCLPAAPAYDGALLRLRPDGGADHDHGPGTAIVALAVGCPISRTSAIPIPTSNGTGPCSSSSPPAT